MSRFEIISPVDGSSLGSRPYATPATIAAAAEASAAAFRRWRQLPLATRGEALLRFVAALEARRATLAERVTWQMGRPLWQADELGRLRAVTERLIAEAPQALATREIDAGDGIRRFVSRDPVGPCLSICAWNYPVAMPASQIVAPLLAGNTVLFKHAPQTAEIGDFLREAAVAADLPAGVLQVLDMTHADTETLMASGAMPLVQFIGSNRGGRAVNAAAGRAMTRVGLELGGKDPVYIRPDVKVEAIVADLVEGCFGNAGQSCCSVERLYVHEAVYDRFVEAFVEAARAVTLGHPINDKSYIGPVVSADAARRIRGIIADATAAGARAVVPLGASPLAAEGNAYVEPHILLDVDHDMAVMRDETFGPVAPIMKVAGDAEAVALMNDSDYGLTASIWTADLDAAVALGQQVESGTFYVNRCDHADLNLPWGGVKQSGVGRSYSYEGFEELTAPRAFHIRPALG